MNAARRKTIERALALLEEVEGLIGDVSSDEQDAHDSVSERFPGSEREAALSESSSALMEAEASLADLMDHLREAAK